MLRNSTFSAILALFLWFPAHFFGQAPGCPAVNAGTDQSLPCTQPCTDLTATPISGFQTTAYTVGQIPYSPFPYVGPNSILVNIDDVWGSIVNLPFNFCFFGNVYNQAIVGSNGAISFNTIYANTGSGYVINFAIPSAAPVNLHNTIMGPWHDIDPAVNQPGQNQDITWGLYGSFPCRVFVVSWSNIPMYSFGCNQNVSLNATHQIAIYETTNIIEHYIESKQVCGGWNSGAAIQGIQNSTGTVAYVVPGRNFPTQWAATNDAWRFTPSGPINYTIAWYEGATNIGNTPTVNVCPPSATTTTYTAEVTYTNCDNTVVVVTDNVNVTTAASIDVSIINVQNVSCGGGNDGAATANPTSGTGPYTYSWNTAPVQNTQTATNLPAGTYSVTVTDLATGCLGGANITITEPTPVVASAVVDLLPCSGPTGQATASGSGGAGNYSYAWNTVPVQNSATATGLGNGTYIVTVTDQNNCFDTVSVTLNYSTNLVTTQGNVSCNGNADGWARVTASGLLGVPGYSWSTGAVIDSIGGLSAGSYDVTVTDSIITNMPTNFIYTEDFDPSPLGWTLNVSTGVNGADNNFWTVSDDEGGVLPPACGTANNGDQTLHVTSVFCPTCGAAYDAGGLCGLLFCPETNMRAESPIFSTLGFSNITFDFDYISMGDLLLDNCSVLYNAGAGWNVLNPSIKSVNCFGGQGQWTTFTATLPPACDNNGVVRIGFNWTNNDDGVGADPSIAINNIRVFTPGISDTVLCASTISVLITEPTVLVPNLTSVNALCGGITGSVTASPTGGNGNYHFLWSTSDTTATVSGLGSGTYVVTITDTSSVVGGGSTTTTNVTLYTEDFDPIPPSWTLNVPTGVNGVDFNYWVVNDNEGGVLPPGCGVASNGDQTLHITSVFCPACGAAYDAGGLCGFLFCPESNVRAESPGISTIGFTNPITLNFEFISMGDGLLDNCSVMYNAGAGWNTLNPSIKSVNCFGGQGQWTAFSAVLPGVCNNVPSVQIGFNWTNNDDGAGADPSVAINNVELVTTQTTTSSSGLVICSTIDSISIQASPAVNSTIGGTAVTCPGTPNGTAWVSYSGGTAPFTVSWSTGAVTDTITGLNAGTYNVTVTDSLGCTSNNSFVVTSPAPLLFTVSSFTHVTCFGFNNGTAQTTTSGGTPGYTYEWNTTPIQTGANATNLSPGTWSVTVTDFNGCQKVTSISIIEPAVLSVAVTPYTATCGQNNGEIFAVGTGGILNYAFTWSNGMAGNHVTGLAPGNYSVTITDANGCTAIASTVVPQQSSPIVSAGPDVSFCEGTGGAQITSSAFSGTSPYYYTWTCNLPICALDSVFDNDPWANPNQTATYYIQVIDFNGCPSNIDSLVVVVMPTPIVNAGPDLYLCGDSAPCQLLSPSIFNSTGPYTYLWIPAIGLNDATILNPCARPDTTTIYTLLATSANGCTSVFNTTDPLSTVVVHVNPIPVGNAGPDLHVCYLDSVMLTGIATGAGPVYDFEWSPQYGLSNPNIANPNASPPSTTDYILTVWSNGCPSYGDTVTVNVHVNPTADAGPNIEICLGETGMLDAQASGDPGATYTFNWSPGTGVIGSSAVEDLFASPPSTTTYFVTATSNWGCDGPLDSATIYLKPTPISEAGPTINICSNDPVQLNGGYYYTTTDPVADTTQIYYSWSPSATLSDTTLADPMANPVGTTMYYLTVTYNTCTTTDSVMVTVLPKPTAMATADTSVACEGDTVQLYGSGGTNGAGYFWYPATGLDNPNAQNPVATAGDSITYFLVVNEGPCRDTTELTLNSIPGPDMGYMSSFTVGCVPFEVSFLELLDNALLYTWNFGDGSPISNQHNPLHTYTLPGDYTVTLSGLNTGGCKTTVNDLVIHVADTAHADFRSNPSFPIILTLPNTHVEFFDESYNASAWAWDFGTGFTAEGPTTNYTYLDEGQYFVTLTVQNEQGCISKVTHGPYIILAPDLFIPNVFSPNDDNNNDVFLVKYTGSQPFSLQIFDRWGNLLSESRDKYQGWDGKFKGEKVPDGTYYYAVKVGDKDYSGPVSLVR